MIHNHSQGDLPVDEIGHHISQDIVECAICASHFKFSPDTYRDSHVLRSPERNIYTYTAFYIVDPLNNLQQGRAPPAKG